MTAQPAAETRKNTPALGGDDRRLNWLCGALLVVLALWPCREVLAFDFVARDDDINIYFNPHLGPPSRETLGWMFSDLSYMRRYLPLGWLAFSVVYEFSGLSPLGYHAANLALHLANTCLVFAVLGELLRRFAAESSAGRRIAVATVGAALWSLHPFRAETIGWCSGLLYSAAGFWALSSAWAYVQAAWRPAGGEGGRRGRWLMVSAVCYGLSVLTYPMGIALPAVFVALDCAILRGPGGRAGITWRRCAVEKLAFVVPAATIAAATLFGRFEANSFWPHAPTLAEFSLAQRATQSCAVWAYYLWKSCWPVDLTMAPTWLFDVRPGAALFLGSTVFVVGATFALVVVRRARSALPWWLAYLAILAPLVGLTEHPHFSSDRYSYLAGVLLCLGVGLAVLRCGRGAAGWTGIGVLAGVALVFGVRQHEQLRIWQNTDTLLARAIAQSGDADFSAESYRTWAMFHAYRGELAQAREIAATAERAMPGHAKVAALRDELAAYGPAEQSRLSAAKLHERLAGDFARAGRVREAREHFRAARALAPNSAALAYNWAVFSALHGEPRAALELYYRSIAGATENEINAAARLRLLGLMAEAFSTTGDDAPARALRAQVERYREAMQKR